MNEVILHVPNNIHITIIKQQTTLCCIYSDFFSYQFSLSPNNYVFYNAEINFLHIRAKTPTKFSNMFSKTLSHILFSFNCYFFLKFKLKGKGFRIYRRSSSRFMKYYLGHSHFKIFKFNSTVLLKVNKYRFIIFNASITSLKEIKRSVDAIKPLNLYTKRGLRVARQVVSKRRGKSLMF